MTPQKQSIAHDPANGRYGDCHRAALATILDMPIADVPHVYDGGISGAEASLNERAFLASLGLVPINVAYGSDASLKDVLAATGAFCPGLCAILGGKSPRGFGHSVVIADGEIVHDPHPDGGGLVGPFDEDSSWWVTWIGSSRAQVAS
ncbi:hypothetical protein ACJ4V0_15955 [Phreatobacter sp. HK31-P]